MESHRVGVLSGRVPLAVVVVDGSGLVSHWSSGARRLFGRTRREALGMPASDLLPVSAVLGERPPGADPKTGGGPATALPYGGGGGPGAPHGGETARPRAGRARAAGDSGAARSLLWWAYPLPGPGPERLLLLAADAAQLRLGGADGSRVLPGTKESVVPAFAPHTEFPEAGELARRLPDILPSMNPRQSSRIVSRVLSHGYPVLEISLHRRVPVTPGRAAPRRAAGGTRGDSTGGPGTGARQQGGHEPEDAARRRLEFLNDVSRSIGATLDLTSTIREVTEAAVPRFADFAGTHLREAVLAGEELLPPDAQMVVHRVWVTHNDEPGRWDDVMPVGEVMTFPERTPFHRCMTSGQPLLVPRISEELSERIAVQFEKRDLRPLLNGRSMLIVPLIARRVVLGSMVLMRRPGRQPFDEADLATAAELAARAALVLDNARLYTYQENAAETLQSSMLPQNLPKLPGIEVATRYLPGNRLGKVGGDWFDTIRLSGSRIALVVGDVMGHGLKSAARMGQLRTAVQTMAALDMPPEELLRHLDDLAQRLGKHYLATCLYAVYDPVESELTIANAGHVPPVLVSAEGDNRVLDLPAGVPIGVGGVPFEAVRIPVGRGDRLVLCTDGLVEVRGKDIGDGLGALCASAARPTATMEDACDTVMRALNMDGQRRDDDAALLMARLDGIPSENVMSWQLSLHPGEAGRARGLVRSALEKWGLEELVESTELLVSEVVTNALRHAHTRRVELRVLKSDVMLFEVSDDDLSVPVLLATDPDREDGWGMHIVNRLATRWGSTRTASGKTVWVEQWLSNRGD